MAQHFDTHRHHYYSFTSSPKYPISSSNPLWLRSPCGEIPSFNFIIQSLLHVRFYETSTCFYPLSPKQSPLTSLLRYKLGTHACQCSYRWGYVRHKFTAQSSCHVEVHSINKTTKLLLEYKLLFHDLNMHITQPIPILNDNQGAIQWSKGTTTKKIRWIYLRKNLVRENIQQKRIVVFDGRVGGQSFLNAGVHLEL